jgi:hypothetical protein
MSAVQTLHEFALNLLSDPQALADFDTDPQGVLNAAGLGDVTAADVHEIIPLVMDTAPVSVTEALGSFGTTGDVAGSLDNGNPFSPLLGSVSHAVAPVLEGLPNLSGVFGGVSDLLDETGVSTVADGVLHGASSIVHGLADGLGSVPLVGPVLISEDVDLQNTVAAVHEHVADGKIVGALVDAATNHIGDAVLTPTLIDTVSSLPLVGEPLGDLVTQVRFDGGALLGITNESIGSTPVGVHSGQELAAEFRAEDFGTTGDLSSTLDQASAAVPAAPALPAAPAVPAASDVVSSVTQTTSSVTAHLPVVSPLVDQALGSLGGSGVTDFHQDVTTVDSQVSTLADQGDSVSHGLSIVDTHADALDLHTTTDSLLDHLGLGH